MQSMNKQSGLTFLTIVLIMAVFGFFVLLALKITPIYIENNSVKTVLHKLENDASVKRKTVAGIRKMIAHGFRINSIYDFPKENIKIKKTKNRLIIDLTYDKVEPIVANVSVMVSFSDKIDMEILP